MSVQHLATQFAPGFDAPLLPDQFSVKAGFYTVKTITQRNNIKAAYRKLDGFSNTLVFVSDTNRLYKLINEPGTSTTTDLDWEEIILGTEGGVEPVGEWDPTLNSPALTDAGALNRNGEFYFVINAGTGYNFLDPDLFEGALTEVFNGDWIISVGDKWTVLRPTVTWDQITKPQSIVDYVAGTVIAHNHIIGDITGLQTALDVKYDVDDTADHTADFNTVPDADIVEVEFLKTHYYRRSEVDAAISSLGSAISFLSLTDTPSVYTGAGSQLLRVNAGATGLEFIAATSIVTWANLSGQPTTLAGYGITDAAITFTNGLTRAGNGVKLGGPLVDATTLISGAAGTLALHLGGTGATGGADRLSALEVRANTIDMKTGTTVTIDGATGLVLNSSGAAGQVTIDSGPNGPQLLLNTTTASFLDRRLLKKGWEYSGDYSAGYTIRSLPDKNYVDTHLMGKAVPASPGAAQTNQALRWNNNIDAWEFYVPGSGGGGGGGTYSFQNGLTESGGIVRLGGPLTEAVTTIDVDIRQLVFQGADEGVGGGSAKMGFAGGGFSISSYATNDLDPENSSLWTSAGGLTFSDQRATKLGIQYEAAGYEGSDLSLISRGYANSNYWNTTGTYSITNPVIEGKPTFSLLGALDAARVNFITGSIGGTLGVSLLGFRHDAARTTADGFGDVFLGPNNGNPSSGTGGNIVIGQNNLNALVTSGTWLGTPYFSTFRGDRNIVLGFNIANQWTTPTVGNEATSNIIMGQHTAAGTTKAFSFGVVLGHESAKDIVSTAVKWESMVAIGTYTLRSAKFNAGVDNTRDDITAMGAFVGYNATFGDGFGSTLIGNSSGRDAVFLEDYQVLIGGAGRGASLGRANIGIGERALWGALGGTAGAIGVGTNQFNVAVGIHTMEGAGPSEKGTYVGTEAGQGVVIGQKNTGYGSWSLNRVNGHHNMGIGPYAGYMAANTITGSGNAFFGPSTGLATTTVNVSNVMVIANPSAVTATGGYRPAAVSDTIYIGSVGDILFRNDYAGTPKDTLSLKKDGSVAIANALKTTIGVNNTVSTITGAYNFLVGLDNALSGVAGGFVQWANILGEAGTMTNNKSGTTINNSVILGGYLNNITSHALTAGANQFGSIYNAIIIGAQSNITNEFAGGPMTAPMVIGYKGNVQADLGQTMGYHTLIKSTGRGGFAHGFVTTIADFGNHTGTVEPVTVGGKHAVNISANSTAQTIGHGAYGDYSVILGGYDHDIPSTSLRSVVLGGNAIKVGANILDTIHMPKVRIGLGTGGALATDDALTNFIVRDGTTGELKLRSDSTLWKTSGETFITDDFPVIWFNTATDGTLALQTTLFPDGTSSYILIDRYPSVGKSGLFIGSQNLAGSVGLYFDLDDLNGFSTTGVTFKDDRPVKKGIEYFADYSAGFTDRSFIDRGFANSNYWKLTGTSTLGGAADLQMAQNNLTFTQSSAGGLWQVTTSSAENALPRARFVISQSSIANSIALTTTLVGTANNSKGTIQVASTSGQGTVDLSSYSSAAVLQRRIFLSSTELLLDSTTGQTRISGGTIIASSGTITANTKLDVRGTGTTTNKILRLADSADTQRYSIQDNGITVLNIAASATHLIQIQRNGTSFFQFRDNYPFLVTGNGPVLGIGAVVIANVTSDGSTLQASGADGAMALINNNQIAGSQFLFKGGIGVGSTNVLEIQGGNTASAGSTTNRSLRITSTLNYSGGTRDYIGIEYNPTIISVVGITRHYAIKTSTGSVLLGNALSDSLTASTRFDVRGISSGNIFRFATDGNVEKLRLTNAGSLVGSLSGATFSADFDYSGYTLKVPQLDVASPVGAFSGALPGVNAGEFVLKRRAAFGGFLSWIDTDITTYHTADHSTTASPSGTSVRIADGFTSLVTVKIVARRTGGTAGSAGDSAGYVLKGLFYRNGTTVTQIGATTKEVIGESQAGWDANLSSAGASGDVSITTNSAADNTVDWNFEIEVMKV